MKSLAFHKVEPGFSWGVTNCQPHHFREIIREASRSGRGEVCLTFDDGYASFLEYADPELRQFGLSATIYILTDYLGALNSWDYSSRPRPVAHLDRTQIQQLAEHGYRIGSHTCSHRDLTRLSDEEISFELGESRRILENLIDSPVTEISYPFGRYNRRVEELAREAGYLRGWSMEPSDKGPFTFGRLGVYAYDTPLSVRWKLSETPLGRLERLKCRITNSLSRAGRLAFWTARPQRRK